jgi:UDP-3-O-[3-hydroxymyristoyl] glucosamine N-acyltransferase
VSSSDSFGGESLNGNGPGTDAPPRGRFFTLGELAEAVGGRVAGDPSLRLTGVQALEHATPDDLSWVAEPRYASAAAESRAGAFLVPDESLAAGRPCVVVANPALGLAVWLERLRPPRRPPPGVSPAAHVDSSARIGPGASVAPGATVEAGATIGARTVIGAGAFVGEGAELGDDCWIHPNASILAGCRVGSRCIVHAGAVVGSDGFGYVWDGQGHRKIPQVGIVRIEDDVEIGANTTIDRATLGETVVGRGTKIDNLVQIGHNVVIGERAIICGQAGIAGSSHIGARATLAGQVGISDHAFVGDGAILTGQAGLQIGGRAEPGAVLSGMPAAPHRDFLKSAVLVARLPELARRLDALEKGTPREPRKG